MTARILSRARSYLNFFDKALQAHLAYGGSLLVTLLASATGYLITIMIWQYAFKNRPVIPGFYAYLTLGFILTYSFNVFLERSIGERIREGLVATDLLKPVDFQLFYLVQALSDVAFQLFVSLIIWVLGYWALGSAMLPAGGRALAAFSASFALAFLIQYGICFIFVQGIFLTNSNYGIMASRTALHQAFSGVFAPLTLFPPAFKAVAQALPFQHTVFTPASIYLGWIQGPQVAQALMQQALWALGLLLAGRLLFRAVLSKISIQGG
jgi:ABC-2 type transport system permease protein